MKKVNIDECYVALISRYKGYEVSEDLTITRYSDKVKFTIIKNEKQGKYKDLLTDECYKTGVTESNEIGTLFVNNKISIVPLNSIVKLQNKFISKKNLLKLMRKPLIDLISLIHLDEAGKIIKIDNVQTETKIKNTKIKNIRGINTEKLYIASLREVTYEKIYGKVLPEYRHYKHDHHNFVIVKKCPFRKGKFKDIRFGTVYKNIEDCSLYKLGLYSGYIWSFNYKTGNKEKKLSYTKVLDKFHETADYLTKKHNL